MWDANLILFALALLGLLVALFLHHLGGALIAAAIMIVTFLAGALYTIRMPDRSIVEFRDVLAHGEIVLLVDVPRYRVAAVEQMVSRRRPEAIPGGATWMIRMLHA